MGFHEIKTSANPKTNKNLEGDLVLPSEELLIQLKQRERERERERERASSLINSVQHAIMAEMDLPRNI